MYRRCDICSVQKTQIRVSLFLVQKRYLKDIALFLVYLSYNNRAVPICSFLAFLPRRFEVGILGHNRQKTYFPRILIKVFVVCRKKLCIREYSKCALWKFWSVCANGQADFNLRWAHMSEGTFSDVPDFFFNIVVIIDHIYDACMPVYSKIFFIVFAVEALFCFCFVFFCLFFFFCCFFFFFFLFVFFLLLPI